MGKLATICNDITVEQTKAIAVFLECGNWSEVARVLGVDRVTVYRWREDDAFAKALKLAEDEIKEMTLRTAKMGSRKMLTKAAKGVDAVSLESAEDVRKWMETGVKLARLTHGESTENLDNQHRVRRDYTPEELAEAKKELEE